MLVIVHPTNMLQSNPPKSPKRFFFKTAPLPPVPTVRLGSGAQVVRTPAEALQDVPAPLVQAGPWNKHNVPRIEHNFGRVSTFDPFRRATIKPISPFSATLLSKLAKPCPTSKSTTLVKLEFGYSMDENTNAVTIPWDDLIRAGGRLVDYLVEQLEESPELTDGSSDSDYDLDNLLR